MSAVHDTFSSDCFRSPAIALQALISFVRPQVHFFSFTRSLMSAGPCLTCVSQVRRQVALRVPLHQLLDCLDLQYETLPPDDAHPCPRRDGLLAVRRP